MLYRRLGMAKKNEFLDPSEKHTLTEQECNLISFYRIFSKTKKDILFRQFYELAMIDKKTAPKGE